MVVFEIEPFPAALYSAPLISFNSGMSLVGSASRDCRSQHLVVVAVVMASVPSGSQRCLPLH
jgi:hypothetical protein